MNTQTQEALKMAIEFIEKLVMGELIIDGLSKTMVIQSCKEALSLPTPEPKTFKHLSEEEKKQVYKVAKKIQKAIGVETPTIAANACLLNIELSCWAGRNIR